MAFDGTLKFDTAIDKSGFEQGISSLGSLAKKGIAVVAGAVTAAAGAVAAIGGYAVSVGKDFEAGMSQVAATLGYSTDELKNKSSEAYSSMQQLTGKAEEMGAATSFSAAQAADGLNILAMSGYSAAESIDMIENVLDLAAAGNLSLAEAASYAAGSMKGFAGESGNFADSTQASAYYADMMAKGATLAATDVRQLGEAMTMEGAIVADFITAGVLRGMEILNGGGTFHVHTDGTVEASAINITGGSVNIQTDSANFSVIDLRYAGERAYQNSISAYGIVLTDNTNNAVQSAVRFAPTGIYFHGGGGGQTAAISSVNGDISTNGNITANGDVSGTELRFQRNGGSVSVREEFAEAVTKSGAYVSLSADIDCNDVIPAGLPGRISVSAKQIDGNGHSISNLHNDSSEAFNFSGGVSVNELNFLNVYTSGYTLFSGSPHFYRCKISGLVYNAHISNTYISNSTYRFNECSLNIGGDGYMIKEYSGGRLIRVKNSHFSFSGTPGNIGLIMDNCLIDGSFYASSLNFLSSQYSIINADFGCKSFSNTTSTVLINSDRMSADTELPSGAVTVTTEQLRDAAYLRSLGFPIGAD